MFSASLRAPPYLSSCLSTAFDCKILSHSGQGPIRLRPYQPHGILCCLSIRDAEPCPRVAVNALLSILNFVVIPTVRATANQTSFPLVTALTAVAAVTLVRVWRHAVVDEASAKSCVRMAAAIFFAGIEDSKGDSCP